MSEHPVLVEADVQALDRLADALSEKTKKNNMETGGWEQQIPLQIVGEIYECDALVGIEDVGVILALVTRLFEARAWIPS